MKPKCKHCGKSSLRHKASDGACPFGSSHRVLGYTQFYNNQFYSPKKEFKVWSGALCGLQSWGILKQTNVVVCARTKKRAVEILNELTVVSYGFFNDFFSETGNDTHHKIALTEGVWADKRGIVCGNPTEQNYIKLEPKSTKI